MDPNQEHPNDEQPHLGNPGGVRPWWQTITRRELLDLRSRIIARLHQSLLGDSADVEDATQEALVVLFVNREAINPANGGLSKYAYVVARNRLLDAKRRHRPKGEAFLEEFSDPQTDQHASLESRKDFAQILDELDPVDRYLLWRHVVEKRSVAQVAAETGLYWHKAAQRIGVALRHLQRRLGEHD